MNIDEAKKQFIDLWGNFGSQWGINRSMAQVHALLLVSDTELSTDEVMEMLGISRGNANMNLRDLLNWNLIYKVFQHGDRKEYFKAEKDIWEVAKRIVRERKRREIEPLVHHIQELRKVEGKNNETASFTEMMKNIERLVTKMNSASDALMRAEESKFFGMFVKLLK